MEFLFVCMIVMYVAFLACVRKSSNVKQNKDRVVNRQYDNAQFNFVKTSPKARKLIRELEVERLREEYRIKSLKQEFASWVDNCNTLFGNRTVS